MKIRSMPSLTASFLILGLIPAFADTQIIPQVADGGGWSTTIVLVNKTSATQSASLSFNSSAAPWTPPFVESVSLSNISLPAGSALFLHTRGTEAALTQGWGQLDAPAGVTGYAIFTQRVSGRPDQDATAPAVTASSRILIPFDNTSALVSAFAVANPTGGAETVQVNVRTSEGTVFSGTLPTLPAKGQTTFLLAQMFSGTAGKSGLAEFYVASGSIAIIALRANGAAFTAAPVYSQTGSPIIGAPNTPQTPSTQTQVIPQVADGAGWSTTIVLTNTSSGALPVTLNFKQAIPNGGGVTQPWVPPFQDSSALNFNIPAGSSVFLRTPGNAIDLSQGWAELVADPRITGYAIFTSRPGGRAQDSTAPAVSASSRILVPFDNSSGLIMALALVDPNASGETVSVNFRTSDGTTTNAMIVPDVPSQGQITFLMPQQFPDSANKSGLAEFYVSSGTISIIALRANPGGAVTSAPVFFETGTPVITTGGGGNGGGGNGGGGGGQGGSTLPTQQEIDTWSARGSYVSGSVTLGRSTIYLTTDSIGVNGATTTTTITKGDGVNASFTRISGAELGKLLNGQLPPGYPNLAPSPGSCAVYDITALTNPYPSLTFLGLDAGPQITVNGPNGTQSALRQGNQTSGFSYHAPNVPNTYLAAGHYTFNGPGGADVGSFSGALDTVQDFVVTNPDSFKVIDRASGATIQWTGGDSSTVVTIGGASLTVSQTGTASGFAFACIQNTSAGSFTVPASILTQLAPSSTINAGPITLVTRGSLTVTAPGKGVRLTSPSGVDILTANNGWTWTFNPQYK